MQFFSTLVLASTVSAVTATALTTGQRLSMSAIEGVFPRQVQLCKPVPAPATCEKSCGAGNIQCIRFPTCYNPSAGESCCSNGKYCPKNYYCTDGGCCPVGKTLAQCGATTTLSVIPPPEPDATSASSSQPTTSVPTTSPATSQATSASTSSFTSSSSATTKPLSTHSATPSAVVPPNTTTSIIPIQITGAAQKMGSEMGLVVLGGIGMLLFAL
ncbi:hypothetical protein HYFRA_00006856 [Hymenoscyphus fraxineus]|uniref:GPI anchored serine-threonine rich protein n=1 Tax=Hymenoscyphus fraxineus TaxID=746836 RepID=A0A9N9PP71_9HELO|nr:hypothetical protein HYFRA_00006856 [Hymenoscyphus fraxineus]